MFISECRNCTTDVLNYYGHELQSCAFVFKAEIKNGLRTTMTNERVTHLSLMSIEYDILRETDLDDLITDFAQRKGRKVSGQHVITVCVAATFRDIVS